MWTRNLAGPFIFDPDRDAPSVDLDAWELTANLRERHKPTGCEFRTVLNDDGQLETYLKDCHPRRMPPPDQLAELAHASVVAGAAMLRERAEFNRCDWENKAERVPPWG